MCGILALASAGTRPVSLGDTVVCRMRDTLERRGPDGSGLWRDGNVVLAHRRLAIIAPEANQQPLELSAEEAPQRVIVAFNGELYDPDALRKELLRSGCQPTRGTDTELLALAIARWGSEAFRRLRGMFAVVAWLPTRRELLVARDPLGIVPLFQAFVPVDGGVELVVASEPTAILSHPGMSIRPDWPAVANYLMTLRTSCGERTLFEGVRAVEPGTVTVYSLDGDLPTPSRQHYWQAPEESLPYDEAVLASLVRSTIEQSVAAHLRSDVPVCGLLSGGLDSAIIAACAREHGVTLQTFCAGAVPDDESGDLAYARRTAQFLGTNHREAHVDLPRFASHWPWMVQSLGLPLSTPNEVAIHAVGEALRPHAKVALSGEGADELFAGYGPAIAASQSWITNGKGPVEEWHADALSWVRRDQLAAVLQPAVAALATPHLALDALRVAYQQSGDPRSLRTHLDVQRRLNLTTLLRRLNTALMLASVEGRTPFADRRVAELAARLPLRSLYANEPRVPPGGGVAVATLPRTKRILRQAFADLVPEEVLTRPKASFPLPFEQWVGEVAPVLATSASAREVFSDEVRTVLLHGANPHWMLAWPIVNVALWLRRWWD